MANKKTYSLSHFTQRIGQHFSRLLRCWQLAALNLTAEGPIALCPTLSSGLPLLTA